jgi:hypothetical protein
MPQAQARDDRRQTAQPQAPNRHAVLHQLCCVADACHRSGGEISPVGDQAETGKEAQDERAGDPQRGCDGPDQQRHQRTEHRTGPSHHGRLRIHRQVRAGDRQRVQHHAADASAGESGPHHVSELVHRLHSQPRTDEGRNNQDAVKNAVWETFAGHVLDPPKPILTYLESVVLWFQAREIQLDGRCWLGEVSGGRNFSRSPNCVSAPAGYAA